MTFYRLFCKISPISRWGKVGSLCFDNEPEANMVMERYRQEFPTMEFEIRGKEIGK